MIRTAHTHTCIHPFDVRNIVRKQIHAKISESLRIKIESMKNVNRKRDQSSMQLVLIRIIDAYSFFDMSFFPL